MTPTELRYRKFTIMKQRSHPPRVEYGQQQHIEAMREITEAQTAANARFQLHGLENSTKQTKALTCIADTLLTLLEAHIDGSTLATPIPTKGNADEGAKA